MGTAAQPPTTHEKQRFEEIPNKGPARPQFPSSRRSFPHYTYLLFFARPPHYVPVTRLRILKKVVVYRYAHVHVLLCSLFAATCTFSALAQEQALAAGSVIDEALGATSKLCAIVLQRPCSVRTCVTLMHSRFELYAIRGAAQPTRALRRKQSFERALYTNILYMACERFDLPSIRFAMID